jgi:photosystem II stability/assembly factor-like uncharacterized protein
VAENSMTEFFPAEIFFSDSQHGWILWHWAMMNPSASALTATSDGGRTWKTLPEPPGAGPMQFTSSLGGWMAGAAPGQEKSPFKENNQLWATHDGGEHWSAIPIPVPTASPEGVRFGALKFNDEGDGVVVAEYPVSDYVQEFITCVTHDGGRSWKFSQFDGYEASPSLVGAHVIWTMFHPAVTAGTIFEQRGTPNSIRIDDREFLPSIPEEMSLEGVLNAVEFIDDSNGWTTYINGRPARFGQPRKAFASLELLATTDGGKTFRSITPRAAQEHPIPPPELYLLNGSILRFPPLPPLAVRPPPIPSTDGCQIRFRPSVGGPMILSGTRFRSENTVWLGSHAIPVASNDGKTLKFLVPFDVTPGTYKIFVENTNGKTNDTVVTIRPAQPLRISNIQNGEPLHPGQHIILSGSGFLLENIVWFGAQGAFQRSSSSAVDSCLWLRCRHRFRQGSARFASATVQRRATWSVL